MARLLTFASQLLVGLGTFVACTAALPQETNQTTESEARILTDPGPLSATNLHVRADCDRVNAGLPLAEFTWTLPKGYADRQRIDVTPFREGFKTQNYETIGEAKGDRATLKWRGGEAGINYYWRVLTLAPDGWVVSETGRYEVPTCPIDFERQQDRPD